MENRFQSLPFKRNLQRYTSSSKPPLQCEAFMRIGGGGDGNSRQVVPGVVATKHADTGKWDAVVACKVQWVFSS